MKTFMPHPCPPVWSLLLAPALTLLCTGLALHPLAPEDALALLSVDWMDFLIAAGLAGRTALLAGAALLLPAAIRLLLALFGGLARRLGYHSGMTTNHKRSRLSYR